MSAEIGTVEGLARLCFRAVRRLPLFVVLLVAVFALAACGSDDDSKSASKPATTPATTPAGKGGCTTVDAPAPKPDGSAKKPSKSLSKAKTYTAEFVTNCGNF